jgi:formyltetrahydrofolate deformylase
MSHNFILTIDTPDESGLIYKITKLISETGLNIVSNDEFVDNSDNHFFMRTEIEGLFDKTKLIASLRDVLPKTSTIKISGQEKKRVVILATKEHHCLGDLLIRNAFNDMSIEILAVISNYASLKELTEKFNIPFHFVSHENISREEHEILVLDKIKPYSPDYIVLAKYMRILSPWFVSNYQNQIINIHHSFLPAFIGANPYKQAFERGVKIIGATSHFVNNNLDEGPIIMQEVIPIDHSYSAESMRQTGKDAEKLALSKALKLVFEDRVFIRKNKTIIFK